MNRKTKSFKPDAIPRIVWNILNAVHWAAFIISIIAAARGSDSLSKATIVLLVVGFAIQAVISLTFLRSIGQFNCDRFLVLSSPISIPFLTIRVLYGVLSTFRINSDFGKLNPNIFSLALMQYLMELIVAALFLFVGWSRRVNEPRKNTEYETFTSSPEPLDPRYTARVESED
jgi:hypothetical protein